jgi:hypothetical protein
MLVPTFLKIGVNQIVSMIVYLYRYQIRKFNNIFKEIFELFCDVVVLNMFLNIYMYVPLRAEAPDALVSGGREGVNQSTSSGISFF